MGKLCALVWFVVLRTLLVLENLSHKCQDCTKFVKSASLPLPNPYKYP